MFFLEARLADLDLCLPLLELFFPVSPPLFPCVPFPLLDWLLDLVLDGDLEDLEPFFLLLLPLLEPDFFLLEAPGLVWPLWFEFCLQEVLDRESN